MTNEADKIAKLPRWAQDRISALTADVAYWQTKANVDNAPTNVRIKLGPRSSTYLPAGGPVEFTAGDTTVQVYVAPGGMSGYANGDHVVVRVQPDSPGGAQMSVLPMGANSIVVRAVG